MGKLHENFPVNALHIFAENKAAALHNKTYGIVWKMCGIQLLQ